MLTARNVVKEYNGYKALSGVNVQINEGEFVIITGKSGSGKSTLLYVLSGLEKPSQGKVEMNDVDIYSLSDEKISNYRRAKIGFVFQFFNLVSSLTIKDNIILPLKIGKKITKENIKYLERIMQDLEIEELQNKYPNMLSGGQQQRVAIARALVINPEIIFADEPTGNLDSQTSENVMKIFSKLNQQYKKTIVMVTHDNSIVEEYGTRCIVIKNGQIE